MSQCDNIAEEKLTMPINGQCDNNSASQSFKVPRFMCHVPNCRSALIGTDDIREKLSFHSIPLAGRNFLSVKTSTGKIAKLDMHKLWLKATKIKEKIKLNTKVCSQHFRKDDFAIKHIAVAGSSKLTLHAIFKLVTKHFENDFLLW